MAYYYEINSQDKVRFARNPWQRWREYYADILETNPPEHEDMKEHYESIAYPSYWQKKLQKAKTVLLWLVFPSEPQKAGEIIDGEYQVNYKMLEPDYDWQQEPEELIQFFNWKTFTSMQFNFRYFVKIMVQFSSNYHQLHRLFLRFDAAKRGTLLLAALKRYKGKNGYWPDSLEKIENLTNNKNLIDPRNNGSFVYKKIDNGFELYSIGPNKIDEGGNRYEPADDWPIWPQSLHQKWKNKSSEANDTAN